MCLKYILILIISTATVKSCKSSARVVTRSESKQNEKSSVQVVLNANGKPVINEGMPNDVIHIYNAGDELNFACAEKSTSQDNGYKYSLVHQRNGYNVTIPTKLYQNTNKFYYTITANDFDSESKIICITKKDTYQSKDYISAVMRLIVNSDKTMNDSINEILYHTNTTILNSCTNDTLIAIQNGSYYNYSGIEEITLTPSNSTSVYFCEAYPFKYLPDGVGKNFTRKNYNIAKYLYTPLAYKTDENPHTPLADVGPGNQRDTKSPNSANENEALSSTVKILIGAGVVVFIVLVLSFLLLRYKKKKKTPVEVTPPNQDTELYACPNQIIYADLDLSETPDNATVSPAREDSTNYVEIGGFLAKK